MTNDTLLRIYLNDHLGASMAGLELARRALASNEEEPFGGPLRRLVSQIESDRSELAHLIDLVGGSPDAVKQAAGWVAEKIGRLKPNGRLIGYSPLSRVVELEGLVVGIEAKLNMWRVLYRLAEADPRLDRARMGELIRGAEAQREEMEGLRLEAAALAFSARGPDTP